MADPTITYAIGFVRRVHGWDYEIFGERYKGFFVIIEKVRPQGELYYAFVENPLFQSLLTTAFATGVMVDVVSHSTTKLKVDRSQPAELVRVIEGGLPVIDGVEMPPVFPQ